MFIDTGPHDTHTLIGNDANGRPVYMDFHAVQRQFFVYLKYKNTPHHEGYFAKNNWPNKFLRLLIIGK